MQENYVFVVVPSKVARSTDAATPLELDQSGNLVKSTAGAIEELKLQIPFSLKNLKMLSEHPLKGKENTPVFHKDSYAPVFDQCGLCSDKVRIFFMRKHVADQSRDLPYLQQEAKMREQRLEVTPILPRALYDAVCILRTGTCPDSVRRPMHALRISYAWEIETITRFLGASPRAPAPLSTTTTTSRRLRRRPGCFCGSSPAIGT